MPIYEYQCKKCRHRFEILQKINEPVIDICPHCGGPLIKLISSPAIQFKGAGWYITDYAHKNSPAGGNGNNGHKTRPEDHSSAKKKPDNKEDGSTTQK